MHTFVRPLPTLLATIAICSALAASARAFEQDRFAIGFWVDPPMDERADERYREIADANFTFVIGVFGADSREKVLQQIELCEKYDLKAIVSPLDWEPEELPDSPAVWGYHLYDEPHVDQYPELAAKTAAIAEARPGKLAYINLFPSVVSSERIGTRTYREYVERLAEEVQPGVLSFDHYPTMKPGEDDRPRYLHSLEVFRKVALEHDVPFWNFFNTMPYGHHADPTEAQLRWQIYTALAYGAKGVMYFCYYTPGGAEFPKGGAIIGRDDRPTRHYAEAKWINAALKNLGPTLMRLTSEEVIRIRPGQDPAEKLDGSPVANLTREDHDPEFDFIVGAFRHDDGRRAALLVNYRHDYTAWPTVAFDAELGDVVEVCPETGEEVALRDDSPDMEGLQLSFDSGGGRLFLMP